MKPYGNCLLGRWLLYAVFAGLACLSVRPLSAYFVTTPPSPGTFVLTNAHTMDYLGAFTGATYPAPSGGAYNVPTYWSVTNAHPASVNVRTYYIASIIPEAYNPTGTISVYESPGPGQPPSWQTVYQVTNMVVCPIPDPRPGRNWGDVIWGIVHGGSFAWYTNYTASITNWYNPPPAFVSGLTWDLWQMPAVGLDQTMPYTTNGWHGQESFGVAFKSALGNYPHVLSMPLNSTLDITTNFPVCVFSWDYGYQWPQTNFFEQIEWVGGLEVTWRAWDYASDTTTFPDFWDGGATIDSLSYNSFTNNGHVYYRCGFDAGYQLGGSWNTLTDPYQ